MIDERREPPMLVEIHRILLEQHYTAKKSWSIASDIYRCIAEVGHIEVLQIRNCWIRKVFNGHNYPELATHYGLTIRQLRRIVDNPKTHSC